jgi:hypothetical protein
MSFSLTSKEEKPWKSCHISEFDFFAPLLTKANRGDALSSCDEIFVQIKISVIRGKIHSNIV